MKRLSPHPVGYALLVLSSVFGLALGCENAATETGVGGASPTGTTVGSGGAGGGDSPTAPCTEATLIASCGANTACATHACEAGACSTSFVAKGTACGEADAQTVCDGEGACVLKHCFDEELNGEETDVDCGGHCVPCLNGRVCVAATDCASGVCALLPGSGEIGTKVCRACATNEECAVPNWCDAGTCTPQKAPGAACDSDPQCPGGYCVDKVCCETACEGECAACTHALGATKDGICTLQAIKNADDTGRCDAANGSCGGSCTCGSTGECAQALGENCTTAQDCGSGLCVDGVCCNEACDVDCSACSAKRGAKINGECDHFAITNAPNPGRCDESQGQCGPLGTSCSCNELGTCQRTDGAVCTLDADCVSKHCADGVCCATECTGACNTCAKALGSTKDGTCTAVVNARVTGSCDESHGGCDGGACICDATSTCAVENRAVGVAAGYNFSCAHLKDGAVKCWGNNSLGQLGIGSTVSLLAPGAAVNFNGVPATQLELAAGGYHACALLQGGTVKCWGYNAYGQLGIGSTVNLLAPDATVDLKGIAATQVAVGGGHSCAVLQGGEVICWGLNATGQLGISSNAQQNAPAATVYLNGAIATQVVAGGGHSCALLQDGAVYCWGSNGLGQLGIGGLTQPYYPVYATFAKGSGVKRLAAGQNHTRALLETGSVKCWGYNFNGQLGLGTTTNATAPGSAVDLKGGVAVSIATGMDHTCAVLADGHLKCWGKSSWGQLGLGNSKSSSAPGDNASVGTGLKVTQATGGDGHTCVLLNGDSVKCWGYNASGQLGLGDTKHRGNASLAGLGDNLPFVILTP